MRKHSEVDVITNSSSSVYIYPNQDAIQKTKDLLKAIVSAVGFEGSIDEYFDVDYTLDSDYVETALDSEEKKIMMVLEQYLATTDIGSVDAFFALPWDEKKDCYNHLTEIVLGMWKDGKYDLGKNYNGYPSERYLKIVVTPKNQSTFDLWAKIRDIFTVDVEFDY